MKIEDSWQAAESSEKMKKENYPCSPSVRFLNVKEQVCAFVLEKK